MDSKRAHEIASSPIMAEVTYNGSPIYIEKVNRNTATIHYLDQPNKRMEVSLASLSEH